MDDNFLIEDKKESINDDNFLEVQVEQNKIQFKN